jgi:hypothetical protein
VTPPLNTLNRHKTITNVDSDVPNLDARQVVMGPDASGLGLQVLICDWNAPGSPNVTAMRKVHSNRVGNHIFPCVVATVEDDDHVWLVGSAADAPPVGPIPISQVERVLQSCARRSRFGAIPTDGRTAADGPKPVCHDGCYDRAVMVS